MTWALTTLALAGFAIFLRGATAPQRDWDLMPGLFVFGGLALLVIAGFLAITYHFAG